MPITFITTTKTLNTNIISKDYRSLKDIIIEQKSQNEHVLDSTFSGKNDYIKASFDNGFVGAVYDAYCNHHHLVFRPDDVWVAILTQFSLYINKYSEQLRDKLVFHEGKKNICIESLSSFNNFTDYGYVVDKLTDKCLDFLKDDKIKEWILPDFTTTTKIDKDVCSVIMMSCLEKYFTFEMRFMCGIPKVTLLGETEDWVKLLEKLKKLPLYDTPTRLLTKWSFFLHRILKEFIDSSSGNINPTFWDTICDIIPYGSGSNKITGWISSFCVFDKEGNYRGYLEGKMFEDMKKYIWPSIDTGNIPVGFSSVPFHINDNGHKINTTFIAGHIGYKMDDTKQKINMSPQWCLLKNIE